MTETSTDAPAQPSAPRTEVASPSAEEHPAGLRNFFWMAAYQVVMRTGWIFKTESIIMPAVLDSVAGAGWVRGWLPLLSRFGNSVPPMLAAQHVTNAPRKARSLFLSTAVLAGTFLLLALCFAVPGIRLSVWMPLIFLVIYTAFFMAGGIAQLSLNTLQGKLIPVTRRGRLLLVSNLTGSVIAVSCAILLLPQWLLTEGPRFDLIFAFSGVMFAGCALTCLLLFELPDSSSQPVRTVKQVVQGAWQVWQRDRNFRRLTIVGALFSCSIMLFPHYQNLGLKELGLELNQLMVWVVVQNIGTGLFSIPVGRVADRYGNRLVLLIALLGVASAPLIAVGFRTFPQVGERMFFLVFVFVGLTPVVLKTIQNFTLEICPPSEHPRYLSTLGLCLSAPMFLSPFVGLLIDWIGFSAVFVSMSGIVFLGWLMSFRLREPREHVSVGYWPPID